MKCLANEQMFWNSSSQRDTRWSCNGTRAPQRILLTRLCDRCRHERTCRDHLEEEVADRPAVQGIDHAPAEIVKSSFACSVSSSQRRSCGENPARPLRGADGKRHLP